MCLIFLGTPCSRITGALSWLAQFWGFWSQYCVTEMRMRQCSITGIMFRWWRRHEGIFGKGVERYEYGVCYGFPRFYKVKQMESPV